MNFISTADSTLETEGWEPVMCSVRVCLSQSELSSTFCCKKSTISCDPVNGIFSPFFIQWKSEGCAEELTPYHAE